MKGRKKTFSDEGKLREFISNTSALKNVLREDYQATGKS